MRKAKFFLALISISCAVPSLACRTSGALPNWSTAKAAPKSAQPINILRLEGDRLLWNGMQASESNVREYLGIIANRMTPQPLTVLSYSPRTPPARIQRARLLIEEVVRCTPGECLEVTASRH